MLPLIPKAGVRIQYRAVVDVREEHLNHRVLSELQDTSAKELIVDMLARYAKIEEKPIDKIKIMSMDALVMTQHDYEEAILDAYRQGMHARPI